MYNWFPNMAMFSYIVQSSQVAAESLIRRRKLHSCLYGDMIEAEAVSFMIRAVTATQYLADS
jgi:hypothetical protein